MAGPDGGPLAPLTIDSEALDMEEDEFDDFDAFGDAMDHLPPQITGRRRKSSVSGSERRRSSMGSAGLAFWIMIKTTTSMTLWRMSKTPRARLSTLKKDERQKRQSMAKHRRVSLCAALTQPSSNRMSNIGGGGASRFSIGGFGSKRFSNQLGGSAPGCLPPGVSPPSSGCLQGCSPLMLSMMPRMIALI